MKWWKRGGEHERAMAVAALAPRVLIVITIASFVNLFMAYQSYTALTTKDSQLLEDAREVVYFDEVLTMSARLAALTGETRWKTRYAESEPNLDAAIQRILQSAPEQAQEAFERTKQANDGLVALEHEAQKLEEPALLFGDRYENLKSIYSTGVQKLLDQVRESSNQRRETTERNVAIGYWLSLGSLTTLIWLSFIQRRLERDDERLRRELIVIARRHTVDRLAASLAHELTQPLGAATLYAEAADAAVQKGETETAQEAIKGSLEQCRRASDVVALVRSFARNAPQKRERLLLADRVRSAVRLTEAEARLTGTQVQVELVSPEAWVEGDPVQLEQVFVNLLLNAIEACEGSGRPPAILIRTGREEGGVVVEVVDNGPGIQIEGRDLFDALVTTKSNGLGMGLAIARDIVEAHTGSITSLPTSDGAILRVWLPECHDC